MNRNERLKANREYLKSIHRCIRCQSQDAYTIIGKSYCFDCADEMAKRNKIYRDRNKELKREKEKLERDERRENNLCTCCGKKLPPHNWYMQCPICRAKKRKEKKRYDKKKGANYPRGENGICWTCNKNPVMEGKRLCKECYERQIKILENRPNKREAS